MENYQLKCRKNYQSPKGITLVALVVTIIVLLILAGVAINLTIGNNGLFTRADKAKEEHKKAQIIEYLDMKLLEEQSIHYEEGNRKIIEATRENVYNNKKDLEKIGKEVEVREVEGNEEDAYFYVVVDKGVYKVGLDGTKYLGKQTGEEIDIEEGDIEFNYNPTLWTKGPVNVNIKVNKNMGDAKLLYRQEDEEEWKEYKEEIEVYKNQEIYAKVITIMGETKVATGTVNNIDDIKPTASISVSSAAYVNQAINATVTHTDNETGVKTASCKWVYNTNANEIGDDESQYTGGTFSSNTQQISIKATSAGEWYLHILTVDSVGNKKETISGKVTISALPTSASNPNIFNYTGGIQTYTVPVTGVYKLEAYGAQGGCYNSSGGGLGGYSVGYKTLNAGQILYICVGGQGRKCSLYRIIFRTVIMEEVVIT